MQPVPRDDGRHDAEEGAKGGAAPDCVHIATIICGRCGWPNGCRVQRGMRALRFLCQWCGQMATGIVDPTLKRNVIF